MTLQECKDQVAKDNGFINWNNFLAWSPVLDFEKFRDEAAQLFGDSQYNQALEDLDKMMINKGIIINNYSYFLEELKRLKR